MDKPNNPARFRSATEFPRSVDTLERQDVISLYQEMRECLVFTNRSRAQLIRYNSDYREKVTQLKQDVQRLNLGITQLAQEKANILRSDEAIIQELQKEMLGMTLHLDQLSFAFDQFADIDSLENTKWSFMAFPKKFFGLLGLVRGIVMDWRRERNDQTLELAQVSTHQLPAGNSTGDDIKTGFQTSEDPASMGRALLDNK